MATNHRLPDAAGNRAPGLEVGGDEGEGEVGGDLDIGLGKAAAYMETATFEQKTLVGMWPARAERESAEQDDVDVGVETGYVLPIREVQPGGLERVPEFLEGTEASHLFDGQDIRFKGEDAFADFGFGLR